MLRCFGKFAILSGQKDLGALLHSRKTEEYLAYLFCHKGAFVAKNTIGEALWEDLDPKQAMNNFYKISKHLERCIDKGLPLRLEKSRGKVRLCLDNIDSDCARFLALCDGDAAQWEEAIRLYNAPFLCDETFGWAEPWAAQYDMAYLTTLEKLIAFHQASGSPAKRAAYQRLYEAAGD